MKIKLFTLVSCALFIAMNANAQVEKTKKEFSPHSIRVSYSDGLTLSGSSFWGMGLSDAITGTKRSAQKATGVLGLGYRYSINQRFKVGVDFGLAKVSSKITDSKDKTPSLKEKELNFMILPTAEFVYFKRNIVELYGSAAAGINFNRHYETGLTEIGKKMVDKNSKMTRSFAYQVNPIGLRLGNNRIGGFIEAGLGYRGFITTGISYNF